MERKILVGYRPDTHGEDALALARTLASARLARKVLVVQVVDEGASPEAELSRAELTSAWPDDVSVSGRAVAGDSVHDTLSRVADEERADLVVLGSTHRGLPGRVLMGTTTGHLAPLASCPLAVAPRDFRDSPAALRRIGVAYDGSDESRLALEWAVAIASDLAVGLRLLAVVEPPPPAETWGASVPGEAWSNGLSMVDTNELLDIGRERMSRQLATARESIGPTQIDTVTIEGDAVQELRDAAADLDMLVVGSHDRGRFDRAVMGSVSQALARSCPVPLVVVPAGAARTPSPAT